MGLRIKLVNRDRDYSGIELALANRGKGMHDGVQIALAALPEAGRGVAIGAVAGSDERNYDGVLMALLSGVGMRMRGASLGALASVGPRFLGLSMGGLVCKHKQVRGLMASGLLSLVENDEQDEISPENNKPYVHGTAISTINAIVGEAKGLFVGALANYATKLRGLQISALYNGAGEDSKGLQIAPINYCGGRPWYSRFIPLMAFRTGKIKKNLI